MPRRSPLKADWKQNVVYLYQFPRSAVLPNTSSFCLKLETWLRMANIDYENVECSIMTRSKEGLLPFVELNGKEICDSAFIIRDLTKHFSKEDVNEGSLSDEQKGVARAVEQMTENSLYPFCVPENLTKSFSKEVVGYDMPWYFSIIKPFFARSIMKRLEAAGVGRHDKEEIINIGLEDIRALSRCLGSKKFFGGEEAQRVDATVFGALAQILYLPLDTPYKKLIESDCKNLIDFCDTMKRTFWPDWDELGRTRALNSKWKTTD